MPDFAAITSRGGLEIGWRAEREIFDLDGIASDRDGLDEAPPRLAVAVGGLDTRFEVHPVQSLISGSQP